MALMRMGRISVFAQMLVIVFVCLAGPAVGQQYADFVSEEYGFTMKYPATWVRIDNPQGNYYKVFQSPDLIDNFRSRIHVAAHKPVQDKIEVFLKEMRNGIKDLQGRKSPSGTSEEVVRILDEGPFVCDVPGAYYFFIQALEDKLKIWMDIVIVFYKHDKTLLRVSCLAPSKAMEQFHPTFNDVLVSVKFPPEGTGGAQAVPTPGPAPAPTTGPPSAQPAPAPTAPESGPASQMAPATPRGPTSSTAQPAQTSPPGGPTRQQPTAPAQRPERRGPTGIVQ